jgi:hypothetical protein
MSILLLSYENNVQPKDFAMINSCW